MYRANLEEAVHLKSEVETTNYFWVKFSRHTYNAKTFITTTNTRLTPYFPEEFKQFIKTINDNGLDTPNDLRAVLGWDEWKVVHDPTLVKDVNDLKIK